MGLSSSDRLIRLLKIWLLIVNALFILVALLVIGVSLYLLIYKADLLAIVFEMPYIRVSVVLLIFCGCMTLLFAFIGMCSAVLSNRWVLLMYCVVLLCVVLLCIASAVMGIVYKNTWYIDEVRQKMRNALQKDYGINVNTSEYNAFITHTWDTVQQMWYCCGVEDQSWGIFRQSEWYNKQPGDAGTKEYTAMMVPASCCLKTQYGNYVDLTKCQNWILGPPNVASGMNENEAILYSGCFVIGRQLINKVGNGVIGLGFGLFIVLLLGIVPAVLLLIRIARGDDAPALTKKGGSSNPSVGRNYIYTRPAAGDDSQVAYPMTKLDDN
jgi:hypothetical protein